MASATCFVVDQVSSARSFSKTDVLTSNNNPNSATGWPAWAVAACIHTLGAQAIEPGNNDTFVTYMSTVDSWSTVEDRSQIMGIDINVVALFYWDWGPIQISNNSSLIVNVIRDHVGETAHT